MPVDLDAVNVFNREADRLLALDSKVMQGYDDLVRDMRAAGCSWELVGKALGMSKQAAQQRWG